MSKNRRAPIFRPETWAQIATKTWSHWDRWYCMVCATDFAGDWDALADRLATRSGTWDAEQKLSHLDDLVGRLGTASLSPADLAGELDRVQLAKARHKVLTQSLSSPALMTAMRNTPRRRLRTRALRGAWHRNPPWR